MLRVALVEEDQQVLQVRVVHREPKVLREDLEVVVDRVLKVLKVLLVLKEGKVHRAHSVGGLATPIGVPADYLKKASFLERIDSAPFYAVAVRTATVAFTACGLRTDRQARVLGRDGRVIPGLFAAGQEAAAHVR